MSLRYIPAICVLLALALVPTIIHSYSDQVYDDGRRTSGIPSTLAGHASAPTKRNPTWGKRRFDSDDWVEREYRSSSGSVVTVTVVRSYDAKTLYHHPELAVAYGRETFGREDVQRFDQRPDVPVHVLRTITDAPALALYALHYDTDFVENPVAFQIRSAGELLFSRRKPMTLFFVLEDRGSSIEDVRRSSASTLLFAAIDAYLAQPAQAR
jgi:hypothetical protein